MLECPHLDSVFEILKWIPIVKNMRHNSQHATNVYIHNSHKITVDRVHIVTNMQTVNQKQKAAAKEPRAIEQVIIASVESEYKRHGKNPSN